MSIRWVDKGVCNVNLDFSHADLSEVQHFLLELGGMHRANGLPKYAFVKQQILS